MYGHDISRTNYNPAETTISAANVNQLVQRWQVNIGGSNGSPPSGAPSVANGRVYVGSSATAGNNFFAFDAATGAFGWSTNIGHMSACWNIGIGATAAISGSVVVAGGGDAAYYGLNADTGAQLWRHALNVGASGFAWASPLLVNDRAYIGVASYCDNPSVQGAVRALDLQTGAPLATQTVVPDGQRGAGIWNSPVISPDGSILLVATGEDYGGYNGPYNRAMVSLDPITLAIRQAHQEGQINGDVDFGTTPLVFHDSANRGLVGAVHKDGTFYAYLVDNINAGSVWSKQTLVQVGLMPAYDPSYGLGGTLFIPGGGGQLYAVDPANGTTRWVQRISAYGNIAVANGLIFINSGSSGLKILDETTGNELRTLPPQNAGNTTSGVAVANGFIYWLSGTYLNAWSLPDFIPPTETPTPGVAPSTTATPPLPTTTPGSSPSSTVEPIATATSPAPTPTATPLAATATATASVRTATATPPAATPTPGGCRITFSEVFPSDYYYEPVRYLYCAGILSGYSDNTFRPAAGTTRGQMVKIIANAYHIPAYTPPQPTFSDVPAAQPFYAPIEAAVHAGIISGYADGTFRPGAGVTRGQLAKIVVNAAGWPLQTPAQPVFTDVPAGSPFYEAIATAACHGIISGYADGSFRPGAGATRGQISKIVYLALSNSSGCAAPAPADLATNGASGVAFSTARLEHLCIIEH
jgi:outer membrane protein assembly factor BamB